MSSPQASQYDATNPHSERVDFTPDSTKRHSKLLSMNFQQELSSQLEGISSSSVCSIRDILPLGSQKDAEVPVSNSE